ncbi:hypothetical protein JTE90_029146 [Oedothorax gibbosus]|uniref:Uncharacterized protein n=1 Tax=Oedothorax gibbosus TaxID=931172 RepID=A0AAV6UB73_9ARAC|nr:hypothetical protein JTE90_029146 [Oedothorax gibbosus]
MNLNLENETTQNGDDEKTKECHVDEKKSRTEVGAFSTPNSETVLAEEVLTSVYGCEEGGAIHPAQEDVTAFLDDEDELLNDDCRHIQKMKEMKAGKNRKAKHQTSNPKSIVNRQEEFDTRKYQQWKLQCDRASGIVSKLASHFKIFSKRRMKLRKLVTTFLWSNSYGTPVTDQLSGAGFCKPRRRMTCKKETCEFVYILINKLLDAAGFAGLGAVGLGWLGALSWFRGWSCVAAAGCCGGLVVCSGGGRGFGLWWRSDLQNIIDFWIFLVTHLDTGVSSWMAGGGAGLWCLCPGAGVLRWGFLLVLSPSPGVGCLFASLVVGAQLLGWDKGCHKVLILGLVPP